MWLWLLDGGPHPNLPAVNFEVSVVFPWTQSSDDPEKECEPIDDYLLSE
jgi:hypothetical protein